MQRLESRFKYLIYPGKPPVCSGTGFATIKAPADVRIFQPGPWAYLYRFGMPLGSNQVLLLTEHRRDPAHLRI
jgi:hypothetical protein